MRSASWFRCRAVSQCQKSRRRAGSERTAFEAVMPEARFQAKKPSSIALPLRVSGCPPGSKGPRRTSTFLAIEAPGCGSLGRGDGLRVEVAGERLQLSQVGVVVVVRGLACLHLG